MQFVADVVGQRQTEPPGVLPGEGRGDYLRRTVNALRLTTRGGVRPLAATVELVEVPRPRPDVCKDRFKVPVFLRFQGSSLLARGHQHNLDVLDHRRPDAESATT